MHLFVRATVLGVFFAASAALPARASVLHLLALLDGAQEVPQVGQAAHGATSCTLAGEDDRT